MLDHSDNKRDAAPTWKKTFGHHPLLAFWTARIAGGEALAGLLRKGNAGSNTAADHITVPDQAHWPPYRPVAPDPDADGAPAVVVRCDSRRATISSPKPAATAGRVLLRLPRRCPGLGRGGHPSTSPGAGARPSTSGDLRDGAWV